MEIRQIMFPTDFSHSSDAALALASSLAKDRGAKLHIVHVEEPPVAYGGGEMYYGIPEPVTEDLQRMLEEIKPPDEEVAYEHELITGDPAHAIADFAKEHDIDLIVMGTHGRTGLLRMLMGSVAEAVVRRAPCPVLTYKPKEGSKGEAAESGASESA